jgi:hypothetical protein
VSNFLHSFTKIFSFLFVCLLTSVPVFVSGVQNSPAFYHWSFNNDTYFCFNQPTSLVNTPQLGWSYDQGLVGYWSLDDAYGSVAQNRMIDNKINNTFSDGIINGATWTTGKFGKALSFDGLNDDVAINSNSSIQQFTFSFWINPSSNSSRLVPISSGVFYISLFDNGLNLLKTIGINGHQHDLPFGYVPLNSWTFFITTYDGAFLKNYVNGELISTQVVSGIVLPFSTIYVGSYANISLYFDGKIDELQLYNHALTANEASALYNRPEPADLNSYYNFQDSITNNSMLISLSPFHPETTNVTLVTCTNFFANNELTFRANNSVILNLWTSLGKPLFTTGVWNSQNFTTTLEFTTATTAELNWNTCNITTYTDSYASVSPSNMTVDYGANIVLSFSATPGYNFNVAIDGIPKGQIYSYHFNNVTTAHSVNVNSAPASHFPETAFSVIIIIAIMTVFAWALKKGHVTIKIVNEEYSEENSEDYSV